MRDQLFVVFFFCKSGCHLFFSISFPTSGIQFSFFLLNNSVKLKSVTKFALYVTLSSFYDAEHVKLPSISYFHSFSEPLRQFLGTVNAT